jgi:hypothetical protein
MGSELDLHNFARFTVEDPVSQIIERLSEDNILCDRFGLKGSVKFENHSKPQVPLYVNLETAERGRRVAGTSK